MIVSKRKNQNEKKNCSTKINRNVFLSKIQHQHSHIYMICDFYIIFSLVNSYLFAKKSRIYLSLLKSNIYVYLYTMLLITKGINFQPHT